MAHHEQLGNASRRSTLCTSAFSLPEMLATRTLRKRAKVFLIDMVLTCIF